MAINPNQNNKSLMEGLKPQLEGQAEPVKLGQTSGIQNLLRTKLTGKAGQPSNQPQAGSMAERQAAMATKQAGRQQQIQGRLQGQQLEQQEEAQTQQFEEQQANLMERWDDMQAAAARQTANILQEFEQGKKRMGEQEANAAAEQAAFLIRFQNKDYMTQLDREGKQARLENDIEFKTKAMEQAFADEQSLLRDNLTTKRLADMNQRQWDRELAQMDINYIIQANRDNIAAQQQRAIFSGLGGAIGAGAQGYASGAFDSKPEAESSSAPLKSGKGSGAGGRAY